MAVAEVGLILAYVHGRVKHLPIAAAHERDHFVAECLLTSFPLFQFDDDGLVATIKITSGDDAV